MSTTTTPFSNPTIIVYYEDSDVEGDLSIVHQAATIGDTETLKQVIQQDPSVLEQTNADGMTPLAQAVMSRQMEAMKMLVIMGANLNAQDNLGRSCLSIAAYQGWHSGVVSLLRNGAKQFTPDKAGRTPLHASTYDPDTKTLGALLQIMSIDDINQKDNEGMTGLHWAAFHNRPEHLQLLLQRGADITSVDIDGKNALHWAAQNGSIACCSYIAKLPSASEQVNHQDHSGKTPVHFAAAAGHSQIIAELAKIPECDLECEDPDERTALHWAAATGQADSIAMLLKLGINPSPFDAEDGTPLDYARQSGHAECIQLLEDRLDQLMERTTVDKSTNQNDSSSKTRKNPLGFIVEFFKGKKTSKECNNIHELSDASQETYNESSISDHSPEVHERIKHDYSNRRNSKVLTVNTAEGSSGVNMNQNGNHSNSSSQNKHRLSPLPRVRTPREKTKTLPVQAEEIIALQTGNDFRRTPPGTARSLSPIQSSHTLSSSDPAGAGRGLKSHTSSLSEDGGTLFPRTNLTCSGLDVKPSTPPQLAPLKGPKPRISGGPPQSVTRLRNEKVGINRTPTPPSWDHFLGDLPTDSRLEPSSNDGTNIKKKKKKKKSKSPLEPANIEFEDTTKQNSRTQSTTTPKALSPGPNMTHSPSPMTLSTGSNKTHSASPRAHSPNLRRHSNTSPISLHSPERLKGSSDTFRPQTEGNMLRRDIDDLPPRPTSTLHNTTKSAISLPVHSLEAKKLPEKYKDLDRSINNLLH
ncbi:unnamed protein product [Owenia fusiformis]|uniref:Uncharacterized protein n=1 Tax=Owenia fusiformis TaxID=6347 RepID=A0A8J1XEX9_OWEFU|nr:unnamed protein product [Owenia fusiformis]